MEDKLTSIVIKLLKESMGLEDMELTVDTPCESLGLGSISFIKFIILVEEKFGFEFDDEELDYTKITTIKDIIDLIQTTCTSENVDIATIEL